MIGFDSLCFKPIDGEGCLVESPSQYWMGDPTVLAGDPSPSLTAACQTRDEFLASRSPCMDEVRQLPEAFKWLSYLADVGLDGMKYTYLPICFSMLECRLWCAPQQRGYEPCQDQHKKSMKRCCTTVLSERSRRDEICIPRDPLD